MLLTACADQTTDTPDTPSVDGNGIGETVRFTVGTTRNVVSRAGEAKTDYMPDCSRFICRMYYKVQTGSNTFDVSGKTDQTAWMKVSGKLGNSLYWNPQYAPVGSNTGKGGIDEYGNDYSAAAFYWQNRKEHAFLAWTDLNRATTMRGGDTAGTLTFETNGIYKRYTGVKERKFVLKNYEIAGVDTRFTTQSKMEEYVQSLSGDKTIGETDAFKSSQAAIGDAHNWDAPEVTASYHYRHGWQHKYSEYYATTVYDASNENDATSYDKGWIQYLMYFDKLPFTGTLTGNEIKIYDVNHPDVVIYLKDPEGKRYIAAAEVKTNDSGQYLDAEDNVTTDKDHYAYAYYLTDEDGNIRYDETKPKYTFYYKEHAEKEEVETVEEYPALAFDLTRRDDMNSMNDQPDIVRAREIQAPTGATQESNRVNLYFKHQFAQVQVNLKNASDNSVMIEAGDINSVELLGVTKLGYVFIDMDENGDVRDAAYQQIDFSDLTEQQIKDNPFGTSLDMFPNNDVPTGYLKSFNAITFGQLQAIRITWTESASGIVHKATYRLDKTDLINLQSGVRYIWNMEIRRGTLAVIRTEIVDWQVPEEEEYYGNADGTIQN